MFSQLRRSAFSAKQMVTIARCNMSSAALKPGV